ncbi:MAG TPA: 2-oxoglutarate dehydrogenase E1 component, partial [Chitinophagaceae bacterium]
MKDFSYITNASPAVIESMYEDFIKDPKNIDPEFRRFFEGFDFAVSSIKPTNGNGAAVAEKKEGSTTSRNEAPQVEWMKEIQVYRMILGYRNKGHLIAKTNPIRERKDRGANLDLNFFGFAEADLDKTFYAGNLIGLGNASLRKIIEYLKNCYASNVGIEFKYISDQKKIDFLTKEMEKDFLNPLPLEKKKRVLEKLNEGVIFEKFLHTKYVGQKRFSLEGGETTIPALDAIINVAADHDVQEVIMAMAHRGRLNVLANILGKTYEQIFSEFEGTSIPDQTMGSGDVK